jgi:RimJ/RimL family protein N-acetyltransferase
MKLINDRARDKELGAWISEKVDVDYVEGNICFGTEKDGTVVGAVMFNNWNGSNVCVHQRMESHFAITRELLHTAFSYAFTYLKARRISGAVIGQNAKAIALNLHLGFELEAVFKDHFPGKDGTILHFVMWPEKCKYLGREYATA